MTSLSAKERILESAKKFFAEKGYEITSVREIAADAQVNLAAINYHFGSKEELFQTICRDFGERKLSFAYSLLKPAQTREELYIRLEVFFQAMLRLGEEESDTVFILLKNIDLFAQKSPEDFQRIFLVPHQRLQEFFEQAKEKGLVRQDVEAEFLSHIVLSGTTEIMRSNKIRKEFIGFDIHHEEQKNRYVESYLKCFIEGIRGPL